MRPIPGIAVPVLASALAVALVIPTWSRLSYTNDEPAHVATGMEWLAHGRYTYEEQHPPLSRIAAAAGPYLLGVRPLNHEAMWNEGRALMHDSPVPVERIVSSARAGMLPFLILAIFVVWHLGTVVWAPAVGGVAAFLLATTPVFLGHAGLATTDIAAAGTLLLAVWLLMRFLEAPRLGRACAAGAGMAVAVMAKLTALIYLGAASVTLLIALLLRGGLVSRWRAAAPTARDVLRIGGTLAVVALLVMWGTYRFSLRPLANPADAPFEGIDAALGESGTLHDVAYRVVTLPVPGSELLTGIRQVLAHSSGGRRSYFLGDVSDSGWLAFFPVALLVKTPVPLVLLIAAGYGFAVARRREMTWQALALLVMPFAIVAAVIPARLHMGVRHVLGVYPFLALVAGLGAVRLAQSLRARHAGAVLVVLLCAWQLVTVGRAFPDYIAYFSEPFDDRPHDYLVFSDLAWGQDLYRLRDRLVDAGANSVAMASMNNLSRRRLRQHDLPEVTWLEPFTPVAGWVAVDWYALKLGSLSDLRVPQDAYAWLLEHEPVAEVGAATRLYHFEQVPDLSPTMRLRRAEWLARGLADSLQTPDDMERTEFGPRRDPW